jgi:integral membrane protein
VRLVTPRRRASCCNAGVTAASPKQLLNRVLAVGIADALLLVVLIYFAWIDRSDNAVHVLGPIHGLGFVVLLFLTADGALRKLWGWWFPAIVLVTGGPLGSIVGDVILRKRLSA